MDYNFFHQYDQVNSLDHHYSFDDINFQSFSSESYSSHNTNFAPENSQNLGGGGGSATPVDQAPHHQITDFESRPAKQLKINNSWNNNNSCTTNDNYHYHNTSAKAASSSSSQIISFEKYASSAATTPEKYYDNLDQSPVKQPKDEPAGSTDKYMIFQPSYHGRNQNFSPKLGQVIGEKRPVAAMSRSPLHAQDHVIAERRRREKLNQRYIALSAVVPGLKKVPQVCTKFQHYT